MNVNVQGQGPRAAKMDSACEKAIEETLKSKEKVMERLSYVKEQHILSSRGAFPGSQEVENFFAKLGEKMREIFRTTIEEMKVHEKLNRLDDMIREDRVTRRDIRSKEYIDEIFDSYVVQSKIDLYNTIKSESTKARKRKDEVNRLCEESDDRVEKMRRRNKKKLERVMMFLSKMKRSGCPLPIDASANQATAPQ